MKRITINKTDLAVSPVCLGADRFGMSYDAEASFKILDEYAAHGGNFLDTAAVYCRWVPPGENISEQIIGRWLQSRRAHASMLVATKGGHPPCGDVTVSRVNKKDVESDIHDSLCTLGLDVIDFYWLHRDDPSRPIEEIIDMMEDFRRAGYIRYDGASNYRRDRLETADAYAKSIGVTGFSAVSNRWSPVHENFYAVGDPTIVQFYDTDLEFFRTSGMSFIPYNSTARGYFEKRRAGNVNEGMAKLYDNAYNDALYEKLLCDAERTGSSMQTVFLRHMISGYDTQIIPITSVSNAAQLDAMWDIFE